MIENLKEEDIEQVLIISDKFIGEKFQTYDSLKNYLQDSHKIIKVFRENDEIIGFIKGEIIEKSELRKSLLKSNPCIDDELSEEGHMGYAETICIKEEFRGTSVAQKLTDELISSLIKIENIDIIYTTLWKMGERANAKKLVERTGFKYITEIPEYWYSDSLEKNYFCPNCGKPPCKCSMMFYKLARNN